SRGWLGVAIQDITPELAEALNLDQTTGVLISDVSTGSPADRAGLERGDIIIRLNGTDVSSAGELRNLVAAAGAGNHIRLEIQRNNENKNITAELGELPTESPKPEPTQNQSENDDANGVGLLLLPLSNATREQFDISPNV